MSALQIAAAVAAAGMVAVVIARRGRLGTGRVLMLLAAAIVLGVYAGGLLPDIPDPKKLIGDIARGLGSWTYAVVAAFAFLETGAFVGLIAPGETVVIASGVIAGQGEIELVPLIGLVWVCAVLGDTASFFLGRRLGRAFMERHGSKVKITPERLEQVESYFERHGGMTILIGRFIGLVRALAPFVAGSSGLQYRRFIPYSVVGTALWATLFCVLGYVFWQSFDRVAGVAGQATLGFGIVVALVVGGVYAYRRLRTEEDRRRFGGWVDRQARRPLLRPLFALARPVWRRALLPAWRFLAPEVRFLWERLTPGGLGLELTTALAVTGAGLYVFLVYAMALSGDSATTPFDRQLLDVSDGLRNATAVDVVKVLTEFGSFPVVALLVVVCSIALAVLRFPREALMLFGGFVLLYLATHFAKAGIDRPRPPGGLVETRNQSYPSGHAAYSVAWVAAAVLITRTVKTLAAEAAIVIGALVVCAVVGLSRIYLRAHYWSDVAGGWALGFGIFGLCMIALLVVGYLRQNARPSRRVAAAPQP